MASASQKARCLASHHSSETTDNRGGGESKMNAVIKSSFLEILSNVKFTSKLWKDFKDLQIICL